MTQKEIKEVAADKIGLTMTKDEQIKMLKEQFRKEFMDKACSFLETRLFPTVKVQDAKEIDVIDRWELIDEFRKAMTAKTNPLFEKCLANVNPETRAKVRRNMDLANSLTWQDVKRIVNIADDIVSNYRESHGVIWDEQAYYKEVLTKFNEERK